MTQQDVAERLNVSNKTVSRWERDECYPDISLISPLAEMLGVSCDELLKGERITINNPIKGTEPKVEKQLKSLINRTVSKFKVLIWISIALSAIGLICMLGIHYGLQRPIIGFTVMLLFEISASVIALIAVNRMIEEKSDNELFESAGTHLIEKFNKNLGTYSFISFCSVLAVFILSLPLLFHGEIVIRIDNIRGIRISSEMIGIRLIPVLAFTFLKCKTPYQIWLTGVHNTKEEYSHKIRQLNLLQLGIILPAAALFAIAFTYGATPGKGGTSYYPLFFIMVTLGSALLLASLVCFIVFMVKYKKGRKALFFSGLRNILITPSVLIFSGIYAMPKTYVTESGANSSITRYVYEYPWNWIFLLDGLAFICTIAAIFEIGKILKKKSKKAAGK